MVDLYDDLGLEELFSISEVPKKTVEVSKKMTEVSKRMTEVSKKKTKPKKTEPEVKIEEDIHGLRGLFDVKLEKTVEKPKSPPKEEKEVAVEVEATSIRCKSCCYENDLDCTFCCIC